MYLFDGSYNEINKVIDPDGEVWYTAVMKQRKKVMRWNTLRLSAGDVTISDQKLVVHVSANQLNHIPPSHLVIAFSAVRCDAMLCHAMQCNAMLCDAMLCYATLYKAFALDLLDLMLSFRNVLPKTIHIMNELIPEENSSMV